MLLKRNAKLVLEDNSIFHGFSFASQSSVSGEVVFSTGMVGYPESLTDPSYQGQILCLTYPLIGNYGVPAMQNDEFGLSKYFESSKIHIQGLLIDDYSFEYSHWNAKKSLAEWLKEYNVPAICGIDTRQLTKKLREKGAMLGKIVINDKDVKLYDPNKMDIVKEVTVNKPVFYESYDGAKQNKKNKKIILIDCGVKNNIIRNLLKRNLDVIRVPYDYDFFDFDFNGIVISNGPGDPKMCRKTIENTEKAMRQNIPIFGICLGNQILALAANGNTYKLKYGHRSQNQPCTLVGTKRCFITTQNHGFAVDTKSLDENWQEFFVNANDGTNEGIKHNAKPFFSVQFHPEGHSGPEDTNFLFDDFVKMLK
ncbi:glutamine-hydrolyzing carbamoyl-phosphate synthase small subunit [Candidatus Woesearchaeota archaeon]|nr:glutamine-hydrolyzing carbamoyl-phosphate synthase small subunit [Candidatus Woesearchaeota archaeon]